MNTYIINPESQTISAHDYDGQVNSIYSLYGSILIDSTLELNEHVIYTDGYATDNAEAPFFIGEKLLLGKALVCSSNEFDAKDVTINIDELSQLVNYDVNDFYQKCLSALSKAKISINKTFHISQQNEKVELTYEWVIYTFNMADERTQNYFLDKLNQTLAENSDIASYFQSMAKRAIEVNH